MNTFSVTLSMISTVCASASVYLFTRYGYTSLKNALKSRTDRGIARYQQWSEEVAQPWDVNQARRYAIAARGGIVIGGGVVYLITQSPWFAAATAAGIYSLPKQIYKMKRATRLKKLAEQIPAAVDIMVSSAKAGNSLETAIEDVYRRMPNPIRGEFKIIVVENRFRGQSIDEALEHARKRVQIESFTMISTALIISVRQGGKLLHILDRISFATRELDRLQKKLFTETADVRMQEKVTMFMTPMFGGLICLFDPSIPDILLHSAAGNILLIVVAAIQVIGVLWIRRILRATI